VTFIVVFLSGELANKDIPTHNSFASAGDDKRLPFPHYRLMISRYSRLPKLAEGQDFIYFYFFISLWGRRMRLPPVVHTSISDKVCQNRKIRVFRFIFGKRSAEQDGQKGRYGGFRDRNALITRTRQSLIEVVKRGMPPKMRRNANAKRSCGDQIRGKSKAQGKWEHGFPGAGTCNLQPGN